MTSAQNAGTPAPEILDFAFCEGCFHPYSDHAFFPNGSPAPFCDAPYKPEDGALLDHSCDCEGFSLITCDYTADGADPTPDNPVCGKPAVAMNPNLDADYSEWYCADHADPAWPRPVTTEEVSA